MGKLKLKIGILMVKITNCVYSLREKDASAAFKIANIVTGDRLRVKMAYLEHKIQFAQDQLKSYRNDIEWFRDPDYIRTEKDVDFINWEEEQLDGKVIEAKMCIDEAYSAIDSIWKI